MMLKKSKHGANELTAATGCGKGNKGHLQILEQSHQENGGAVAVLLKEGTHRKNHKSGPQDTGDWESSDGKVMELD